jgi:hypothetical protein
MNISPRKTRSVGSGSALGVGVLTVLLALFGAGTKARAQVVSIGGLGFGGYGLNGLGYGYNGWGWGSPGFGVYNGLGYGGYGLGYGGYGYNGLGYGAYGPYNGLGYGGYGYGYGNGLNINLGGRNLLHVGRGVNPLWRGGGVGYGRGYYSRNWYGRDFDDWYDAY